MAQFLRPDGNVTQSGFTNGFAEIDEATASDADFAYGANNTAAVLEVSLSNPSGTPGAGTRTVRYRIAKTNAGAVSGSGNAVTVTAELYQGTSLISADAAQTATGTWTDYSWIPDTSSVTDWNDLRLRFTTSASGGSPSNRRGGAVSWAELETPNAAAQNYTLTADSGSFAHTGQAAGLRAGRKLTSAAASFALAGQAVGLVRGYGVSAASGVFILSGQAVSLATFRKTVAASGAIILTGQSAALVAGRKLAAANGGYDVAGQATGLAVGRKAGAASASFALTGQDATLIYSGGSGGTRRRDRALRTGLNLGRL